MKGRSDWEKAGEPYSGLVRPLDQLRAYLVGRGFTVYWKPNEAHLAAVPPEDHTPFSQTNRTLNGSSTTIQELWWVHAIDIMPRGTGPAAVNELYRLGLEIVTAAKAGLLPWLKYMNWPSTGRLDRAQQYNWAGGLHVVNSNDTGHIHLSSYLGCITMDASGFKPLSGQIVVAGSTSQGGDLTVGASEIIESWANGVPTASTGENVEPVKWQIAHEKFEAQTTASLAALASVLASVASAVHALANGGVPVADLSAVKAELDTVASNSTAILERLTAAGHALDS